MDLNAPSAFRGYAAAEPATRPSPRLPSDALANGFRDFATTLRESEAIAQSAMIGQADPHALVQALAQTELAVETVVSMRDKVVEAYQEILRMPV
jgi:flagellar hook-basal body complex protein FliE